ncbi:class I SAM-dependent methyltransferase [Pseudomonadota bacterium]
MNVPSTKSLLGLQETSRGLAEPDDAARAHSELLRQRISTRIEQQSGKLEFSQFMQMALYEPGFGYYMAGLQRFGASGDFITAPELGHLFGRCLARQCAEILNSLGMGNILEVGAGSGALAVSVLQELEFLNALPHSYQILETSADLKYQQKQTIQRALPHLIGSVQWLDQLPESGFCGVVLANELLDAMPVSRFSIADDQLTVAAVIAYEDKFAWQHMEPDAELSTYFENNIASYNLSDGYVSEININAKAWVKSVAERIDKGALLLVDYGYPANEFYHPQRNRGTLICHYRHQLHDDPLILVGLQDITSHVNFSAIASSGQQAGLSLLGYTQQVHFLMALGLLDMVRVQGDSDSSSQMKLTQQIKKLTLPSEMGELFKVIALGKGLENSLTGFSLKDSRQKL